MKTVTLIIPDGYDKVLAIVIAGRLHGCTNVAQRLIPLDDNEMNIDLVKEFEQEKENENHPL